MLTTAKVEKSVKLSELQKISILLILPVLFIVTALIVDDFKSIFSGLYDIILHPDILLTDYIEIGGIGATLINSAILMLVNIGLIWWFKLKINGPLMAAIFTIGGFAFFGKNIFNVWPIYIGCFLYSLYQGTSFKNVTLIAMFGTALSPLVNELAYGTSLSQPYGTIIGILVGIVAGFVLPAISSHMLKAHDGYSLYNIGFTAGFIGTFIMSIMRSYGFIQDATHVLSVDYDLFLKLFFSSFFMLLLIIGLFVNNKSLKGYKDLMSYSGRLVTDFTQLTNIGLTLINMGAMGLIGIAYIIISRGVINGPVVGGLLTVVGFSAFGKHPKNSLPIMIGVFLASLTNKWEVSSTVVIISALFGTTLAPVAGQHGWFKGIITGFIHLAIVTNVGSLHGGINLYNNGFSGGIVATVLVPIFDAFKRED